MLSAAHTATRWAGIDPETMHRTHPPPTSVGACVTGEARSFRFATMRGALVDLLQEVRVAALYMSIARVSSCDGIVLTQNQTLCTLTRSAHWNDDEAALRAELRPLHPHLQVLQITLHNESSCDHHRRERCCAPGHAGPDRYGNKGPGRSGFLQYLELWKCVEWMDQQRQPKGSSTLQLTHVLRTRPDVLYLRAASSAARTSWPPGAPSLIIAALSAAHVPIFIRKADLASPAAVYRRHNETMVAGDWFFVMPIGWARYIFARAYGVVDRLCMRGSFQVARSQGAELFLLRRELYHDRPLPECSFHRERRDEHLHAEVGQGLGGGSGMHARRDEHLHAEVGQGLGGGSGMHAEMEKGMEKGMAAEPPLGSPHDLATHGKAIVVPGCVASFPAIVVRASGEVDCSRVRLDDCYRLATRLVQGEAAAAPQAEAAAAAMPAGAAAPARASSQVSSQVSSRRLADAGESSPSSAAPAAAAAAATAAAAVSSVWPTVRIDPPWPAPPFSLACPRLTPLAQCEHLASDSAEGGRAGCSEPEAESAEVLTSLLMGCERSAHEPNNTSPCLYIDIGCNLGYFAAQVLLCVRCKSCEMARDCV